MLSGDLSKGCATGTVNPRAMLEHRCKRCRAVFTPGPSDPALMDMCHECHSRKLNRATTLVLDRLAEVNPCRFCGHSETLHRYRTTRFLDKCTVEGCGCPLFITAANT